MEKYHEVLRRLKDVGAEPPKGQPYHVMYLEDGKMHVIDIFGTREKLRGVRRNPHAGGRAYHQTR